ncbi:azurin [Shewanella sp. KX20019]|uniref:azurin n=1 Tax=Shewanella sp. KX20019 TaxID=2803864 RepID=UPI0019262AE7|nr:azurin [Shewanella sp. KX20019]QQX78734.1 azurin [Shewanella sp. KX20019]
MKLITTFSAAVMLILLSSTAYASECELTITATDAMQFDKKELSVPATCKEVTLTLTHGGQLPKSAMGHNWVLSTAADMQAIANDGMAAGADNSYVKPKDARVIAHTGIIGGGESTSINFSIEGLTPATAYRFFCSFPGHWAIMQGSFIIK